MYARIAGTGSYLPEKVITNADLEKIVQTSDEWIVQRTGIKERRLAGNDQATSDLASHAAEKALEASKTRPEDINMIVLATTSPDMLMPATACLVQKNIGAVNAAAFDIEIACSGFNFALAIGTQFIETGFCENVLVIGAETYSRILNYQDRTTCVIFGDGAGAAVIKPASGENRIIGSFLRTDGEGAEWVKIPAGGSRTPASRKTVAEKLHTIKMDGKALFKYMTKKVPEVIKNYLNELNISLDNIDHFILHQANVRIAEVVARVLGQPLSKFYLNIERCGNTAAASIPIALDEAVRNGTIKKNDMLVLAGFGGGLSYGVNVIRW